MRRAAPSPPKEKVLSGIRKSARKEAMGCKSGRAPLASLPSADTNGRFPLDYTAGCILLDHSTPARSLERFERALGLETTAHRFLRVDGARFAAEAAGRSGDWSAAINNAKRAVRTIKLEGLEDILRYERLEMIGELAWAHWSAGHAQKASAAMSALVRSLIRDPKPDQARYREVFLKAGHVLGWMTTIAKHA
jgi:hypothetical protein